MNNPPPPPPYQAEPTGQPGQPYVAPAGDFDDKPKSNWTGCLIGCLVAFGLCCVTCAGTGYFVYSNASTWIISGIRTGVETVLDDTDVEPEEVDAILEQYDRLTTAYQEGEITLEELGPMVEDLFVDSPIMGTILMGAVQSRYLDPSGLTEEEKVEANRTIVRVVRGMVDEKFEQEEIKKLTSHFLLKPTDGSEPDPRKPELKQSLSDDELRALLVDAKELADSKEIPDEDYEVKVSQILKEAVDEALGEKTRP